MGRTPLPKTKLGTAFVECVDAPKLAGVAAHSKLKCGFNIALKHSFRESALSHSQAFNSMNVADLILSQGDDAAPAVLCQNGVTSYGELRRQVHQIACALLACGHRKGDRIGIFCENSPFFVAAYLGIIRAGMVAVPLQTELAPEAFTRMASDSMCRILFG